MGLTKYREKRVFAKTPEPAPSSPPKHRGLSFVVQRHDASTLHYDFRLEMEGVLKSWAVPKGPSMNPGDKRLAMMVEDHPYSYKDFEGDIPEGNYGAGHVDIWDSGSYEAVNSRGDKKADEARLLAELEKGSVSFVLHGEKLQGRFSLRKMHGRQENAWLLIKHRDEFAVDEYNAEDYSPHGSARPKTAKKSRKKAAVKDKSADAEDTDFSLLHRIKPMLARLYDEPFDSEDWLFEIKFDGYRAIAEITDGEALLYSRSNKFFNEIYQPVVAALQNIGHNCILDGEIVVLDEKGRSSFQLLQQYQESQSENIFYYAFDLLALDGYDLREQPLHERKELLRKLIPANSRVRFSDHVAGEGKWFYKAAQKSGLEGIVAKLAKSSYRENSRSDEWLKIKVSQRQEAIICGFTEPRGTRKHIGALILGVYEDGTLRHAGNCGSGFTQKLLKELREKFEAYVQAESPFGKRIPAPTKITWLRPELICEVEFGGWTQGNIMRHPIFHGLRSDKDPRDVAREKEIHTDPLRIKEKPMIEKSPERKSGVRKPSRRKPGENSVNIEGQELSLSSLDKVYFPEEGYTKGDVIAYYSEMADLILPYLKDRPQSLHRHPNGIEEKGFFQKDMGDSMPEWIQTEKIYSESNGREIDYLVCNNAATLAFMNNLGCIEINPWSSRIGQLENPDYCVIDLDPGENTFEEVIEVAKAVKEVLDKGKIDACLKTSGSTGLHIFIPMGAKYDYEQSKNFAQLIASMTHEMLPELTSLERSPKERRKQIYLDFLQNRQAQTLASVYSLRPRPGATVSTPLEWKELRKGLHPSKFTIANIRKRVQRKGDLFAAVLGKGIDMEKCLWNLEKG